MARSPQPELPLAPLPPAVGLVLGLGVLLGFAALGTALSPVLKAALHLPLPGSVLGMVLLWAALGLGVVKLAWIEAAADGLLGLLGLLFVPATVGVVDYLSAGASWGLWVLVMASGLLLGAGAAGLLAARLERP